MSILGRGWWKQHPGWVATGVAMALVGAVWLRTPAIEHGSATASDSARPDEEMFVSPWQAPGDRKALPLAHAVTDHNGNELHLSDLVGRPMAVSFAYTRCTNPRKCELVTNTMAGLRRTLERDGVLARVRLLLITYDAEWDSQQDLRDYSRRHGLTLDDSTLFLRPSLDPAHHLFRDLTAAVSFNAGGVTMHGIQLLLIDKAGRLARTYQTLLWDNQAVERDLERLVNE